MSGRDCLNYYFESDRTSAAIVHCCVFDAAAAAGDGSRSTPARFTLKEAIEFGATLPGLDPFFRRRLRRVPGDLAYPHWVEVDVDVSQHIFVHDLSGGPDDRTPRATADHKAFLRAMVVEFTNTPLGWDRPPWQIHFVQGVTGVDGIPDGATVAVFRSHHCAIDGMGVVEMLTRLLTPGATPEPRTASEPVSEVPGVIAALRALPRDTAHLLRAIVRRRRARRALDAEPQPPRPDGRPHPHGPSYPATRFNREWPNSPAYDFVHIDLKRVLAIRSRCPGITVNDVMLTVFSLALSAHLDAIGELPADSLATTIPVSTRAMSDSETANRLAIATLPLHTDVADPLRRLFAVHESASWAKDRTRTFVTRLPSMPLTLAPAPALAVLSHLVLPPRKQPTTVATNTMITNVSYGRAPLALCGAPMTGVFGPLPTARGVYLAHSIASFGSSMFVSVCTMADAVPDLGAYLHLIVDAVDRLDDATRAGGDGI